MKTLSDSRTRLNKGNQIALLYTVIFAGFTLYGGRRYSLDAIHFERGPQ